RSPAGSRAPTPSSAPTASAAPTPARPCAATSRSTPRTSPWPSSRSSPWPATSTARRSPRRSSATTSTRTPPPRCPSPARGRGSRPGCDGRPPPAVLAAGLGLLRRVSLGRPGHGDGSPGLGGDAQAGLGQALVAPLLPGPDPGQGAALVDGGVGRARVLVLGQVALDGRPGRVAGEWQHPPGRLLHVQAQRQRQVARRPPEELEAALEHVALGQVAVGPAAGGEQPPLVRAAGAPAPGP